MRNKKDGTEARRGRRSFLKSGAAATSAAVGTTLLMGQQPAAAEQIVPLYLPVTPTRIYDSRNSLGPISAGQLRTLYKGPADYDYAYCLNVTITDTVGSGWLALYEAGTPWSGASSIGWYTSGQGLSNNALTQIRASDSGIEIRCGGGGGRTQFIIDIIGAITFMDIAYLAKARAAGDDSARLAVPGPFEYQDRA